jgi:hypothetical protein
MAQQLRERINKWDYVKKKKLLHKKRRLKREPTEWEKIFTCYTSDKGLITRTYRELKKLNSPQN